MACIILKKEACPNRKGGRDSVMARIILSREHWTNGKVGRHRFTTLALWESWWRQCYSFGPIGKLVETMLSLWPFRKVGGDSFTALALQESWWRQFYSFGPTGKLVETMLLHGSFSTGNTGFKERLINPIRRLMDDYNLLHFRKLD